MVDRSMRNGSRGGRRIVHKQRAVGAGGFPLLLSVLALLYSNGSYSIETAFNFLDTNFECPWFYFLIRHSMTNITCTQPRGLQYSDHHRQNSAANADQTNRNDLAEGTTRPDLTARVIEPTSHPGQQVLTSDSDDRHRPNTVMTLPNFL
jgi:hypothetical protein